MTILYLLAFFLFVGYVGQLATRIARRSLAEWLLVSFLLFAGSIILTGFILSYFYLTAATPVWAGAVFLTATLVAGALRQTLPSPQPAFSVAPLLQDRWRTLRQWFGTLTPFLKLLFAMMLASLSLIAVTNLLLVLFTVPNEWDSMTGHLNRVMQYIQRGTMRHFGGTNWNMDTYPKSVCTIQIYSFLITGRFESAFRLIHHLSYWMGSVAVFGIVQRITPNRGSSSLAASLFCALTYAMLPDFLMQAITTETDIVLTAYLGVLLYMLFTYRQTQDTRYLYLAGMAFGMAFGHKVTFALLLPSVFVIMIYTVFWADSLSQFWARFWRLAAAISVGVALWTLPTGYLKNIEVFGHPIGPPTALKHQSVERAGSLRNLLEQGSRNLVRYGYDHVNLDGIRNTQTGADLNHTMRLPLVWLEDKLHMHLDEVTDFSIIPFAFDRRFVFYNANPYWGIFGFGLILPLIALVLLGMLRSRPHVFLGLAVALHFVTLSYSAPYDPFKGRYFTETGLMSVTFLALLFSSPTLSIQESGRSLWKAYVGLVTGLGCLSAVLCVYLNVRALPLGWHGRESVFKANRMHQFMVGRPDLYAPYARFDSLVPPNATVALGTINDDYEYPLFGATLSRRLLPINPFERGVQPIPKEAEYLFFARKVIRPQPGDLRLGTDTTMRDLITPGEDYYLRKLK